MKIKIAICALAFGFSLNSSTVFAMAKSPVIAGTQAPYPTPVVPPSITGRVFYIDFVAGSDLFPGTSKALPWKRAPGMAGFANRAYVHQAGDHFIFKGGVTWDYTCFEMAITAGGAAGNPDYYGVDKTWFSGRVFARPIFNAVLPTPTPGPTATPTPVPTATPTPTPTP